VTAPHLDGVSIRPLVRITDDRGDLFKMLRANDPHFQRFGEIYFSGVRRGVVKAWRRHRQATSNLAVPFGSVQLVLHDARPASPTAGQTMSLEIGADNYVLVTVPPGIWTGWQCRGDYALVANCSTAPHDDAEVDREPADSATIPYSWNQ